jgi:DNA polymerase III alpha subunit
MNSIVENIFYQRAKIVHNLDKIVNSISKKKSRGSQLSLFDSEDSLDVEIKMDEPKNFNPLLVIEREKDLTGFNFLYSTFDEFETVRCRYCNTTINQLLQETEPFDNRTLLAFIRDIEERDSKFGNKYAKITFSDGEVDEKMYLFGKLYEKMFSKCFVNKMYLLTVSSKNSESRIDIVSFMPADEVRCDAKSIYITATMNSLPLLRLYLQCYMKGNEQNVFMKIIDLENRILHLDYKVKIDNDNLIELREKGFKIQLR